MPSKLWLTLFANVKFFQAAGQLDALQALVEVTATHQLLQDAG